MKMRSHMRQNKTFGIFHETFKVRKTLDHMGREFVQGMHRSTVSEWQGIPVQVSAGQYETIYINMPPFGLSGVVGKTKLQGRHQTAKGRAGLTSGDDHPTDLPKRPF